MTSPSQPPSAIRTQSELTAMWQQLLSLDPAEPPSLCVAFLDPEGGRPPAMLCVGEVPASPAADDGVRLAQALGGLQQELEPTDVAVAVVRGGRRDVTDADRAWGRCLTEVAGLTGRWPLHLVTPSGARVLAADDVLGAAAG